MRLNFCYRSFVLAAALAMAIALGASAYEQPLSPEAVRGAYFLGRQRQGALDFLAGYAKQFPPSQSSELDFLRVEILTPYAQIVSAAHDDMLNDTAVDSDRYYEGRSMPLILKLWAYCPSATGYSTVPFDRFVQAIHDSSIVVSQAAPLEPLKTSYVTLFQATKNARWANGLEIDLQFDASQFRSAPLKVVFSSPDGQRLAATFDLAALK